MEIPGTNLTDNQVIEFNAQAERGTGPYLKVYSDPNTKYGWLEGDKYDVTVFSEDGEERVFRYDEIEILLDEEVENRNPILNEDLEIENLNENQTIRKMIQSILKELYVEDPKDQILIDEFARLSNEIDLIKTQLKTKETRFKEMETKLLPIIEQASDKCLETKSFLVIIKKAAYDKIVTAGYKELYEWLLKRVNKTMSDMIEEFKHASEKLVHVGPVLSVQKKVVKTEAIDFKGMTDKVKDFLKRSFYKMKQYLTVWDYDLAKAKAKFEQLNQYNKEVKK